MCLAQAEPLPPCVLGHSSVHGEVSRRERLGYVHGIGTAEGIDSGKLVIDTDVEFVHIVCAIRYEVERAAGGVRAGIERQKESRLWRDSIRRDHITRKRLPGERVSNPRAQG